jgi:hypothetical protein
MLRLSECVGRLLFWKATPPHAYMCMGSARVSMLLLFSLELLLASVRLERMIAVCEND